jgi:hypothetical protein
MNICISGVPIMHARNRLIASASLAALSVLLSLGAAAPSASSGPPAPPPKKTDPATLAAQMAKVKSNWDELNAALSEFPAKLSAAFTASVQEEQLQDTKSDEKGGNNWRCESALRTAIDQSKAARGDVESLAQRAGNKWTAAKGSASGCPVDQLPWGATPADAKKVADAISRAKSLVEAVKSAKSSAGPATLAKVWSKAQEYASKQPKCLPPTKAESIIPASVQVPCIGKTVSVR